MLGHTTCCIKQLIRAVSLGEPRPLDIRILVFLAFLALVHHGAAKRLLGHVEPSKLATIGNHVAIQLQVVTLRIAPHEPCLSVVVDEDSRVDVIPRAVLEEGLANSVAERPDRRIADCHADCHASRQFGMCTDVPVELAVALNCLRSPSPVVGPREALQGKGRAVVLPVHHVLRRIDAPLLHPKEVGAILVVTRIDVHCAVVHHRCRVACEPSLDKRVLGSCGAK